MNINIFFIYKFTFKLLTKLIFYFYLLYFFPNSLQFELLLLYKELIILIFKHKRLFFLFFLLLTKKLRYFNRNPYILYQSKIVQQEKKYFVLLILNSNYCFSLDIVLTDLFFFVMTNHKLVIYLNLKNLGHMINVLLELINFIVLKLLLYYL